MNTHYIFFFSVYRLNCNYDFSFFSFLISIDYHHHIQSFLLITEFGQICCIQEFEAVLLLLPVDTNLNNATQKPISLHQLHWRKLNSLLVTCEYLFVSRSETTAGSTKLAASCVLPCILLGFFVFFSCFCAFFSCISVTASGRMGGCSWHNMAAVQL